MTGAASRTYMLTTALWLAFSASILRAQGPAERVDEPQATPQVLAALREGLAEHVIWLTLDERADIEGRLQPWLADHLRQGVPSDVLQGLVRELRAHPVLNPHVGGYYQGVRERWLLTTVDELKLAIARWLEYWPPLPGEPEVVLKGAERLGEDLRQVLEDTDPVPPSEALDAAVERFQAELVGGERGPLWASMLRPLRDDEIVEIARRARELPAPSASGGHYQQRAGGIGVGILEWVWDMQTSEFGETEEAVELAEPRASREGVGGARPRIPATVEEHVEFVRESARTRGAEQTAAATREAAVYSFLIEALLSVRDAVEGRALILP